VNLIENGIYVMLYTDFENRRGGMDGIISLLLALTESNILVKSLNIKNKYLRYLMAIFVLGIILLTVLGCFLLFFYYFYKNKIISALVLGIGVFLLISAWKCIKK
jgi:hypothetical protein